MVTGILAGVTWALETVILGIALSNLFFLSTTWAIALAPFVATFLHDGFSSIFMLLFNVCKGELKPLFNTAKTKSFKWIVLASAIGGPIGMTGYVLAVNNLGASIGAVASAVYPAIGTALAFFFLKENVRPYQWLFLVFALLGVYGLSYSPSISVGNFWLGLLGALMCAFGWGIEGVILAKCLKDKEIKTEYALWIRQATSFLIYGVIILPCVGGWGFAISLFTSPTNWLVPTIALAGLCATLSYLFYYKTISKVGASKAMALNITYTAWAIVFTVLIVKDYSVLNPLTLICASVVVICGILSATDLKKLFGKNKD